MAHEKRTPFLSMLHSDTGAGRRDLLRTGAVALGAALLPAPALARVDDVAASTSWAAWRGNIAALREAYRAEVERLAEELRPRFEAGELRAMTDDDLDDGEDGMASPFWKLGEVCAKRFGCTVTRTADGARAGDVEAARADRPARVAARRGARGELGASGLPREGRGGVGRDRGRARARHVRAARRRGRRSAGVRTARDRLAAAVPGEPP